MFKVLFAFVAIPVAIVSGGMFHREAKKDMMLQAYNNGNQIIMQQEDMANVDRLLFESLRGSCPVPALGVSLHDETMQEVTNGVWLRFAFDGQHEIDGLPFDQLLLCVKEDVSGTCVIRGNNGKFDGRCFYLNLEHNFNQLYQFLVSLPTGQQTFVAQPEKIESNSSGRIICGALNHKLTAKKPHNDSLQPNASAVIPSVNKDKENQNTVIEIAPQTEANSKIKQVFNEDVGAAQEENRAEQKDAEKKPGVDQITFDDKLN